MSVNEKERERKATYNRRMHDNKWIFVSIQIISDKGKMIVEIGVNAELSGILEIKLLCFDCIKVTRLLVMKIHWERED